MARFFAFFKRFTRKPKPIVYHVRKADKPRITDAVHMQLRREIEAARNG